MIPGKNFPPTNKKPHPHYMNRDGLRALEHITEFSVCIIKILSWWKHLQFTCIWSSLWSTSWKFRLNVFHFYEDLNDYKKQHRIDLSLHLGRFKRQVCVLGWKTLTLAVTSSQDYLLLNLTMWYFWH